VEVEVQYQSLSTLAFVIRSIIIASLSCPGDVVLASNCLADASIHVLLGLVLSSGPVKKFGCMTMSTAIAHGLRTELAVSR
jgi:hypothetical protein